MNAREIKKAFKELLPVVYREPNQKPVQCSHIVEVIYYHSPHSGRIAVSCVLQDANCPRSTIRAKGRHVHFK